MLQASRYKIFLRHTDIFGGHFYHLYFWEASYICSFVYVEYAWVVVVGNFLFISISISWFSFFSLFFVFGLGLGGFFWCFFSFVCVWVFFSEFVWGRFLGVFYYLFRRIFTGGFFGCFSGFFPLTEFACWVGVFGFGLFCWGFFVGFFLTCAQLFIYLPISAFTGFL